MIVFLLLVIIIILCGALTAVLNILGAIFALFILFSASVYFNVPFGLIMLGYAATVVFWVACLISYATIAGKKK